MSSTASPAGPSKRQTFSSLRIRNYRLFFFGQLISMSGTWMQTVAQSILVLNLTHSGTVLGLTIGARFGPLFLFGPLGGVIADRMNKRRILYITQALSAALALAFGVLTQLGEMRIWIVYLLAAALGFVGVFDNPARQALIPELVPADQVRNAVTLNSVSANLARILGAATGGGIAAVLGLAVCFDLNAASFVAVLVMLVMLNTAEIQDRPSRPREKGELRAGLAYVRSKPDLLVPLIMVAVVGTLGLGIPGDPPPHRHLDLPRQRRDLRHDDRGHGRRCSDRRARVGDPQPRPQHRACRLPRSAGDWPSPRPRSPRPSRPNTPRWPSSATAASPSTPWPRRHCN